MSIMIDSCGRKGDIWNKKKLKNNIGIKMTNLNIGFHKTFLYLSNKIWGGGKEKKENYFPFQNIKYLIKIFKIYIPKFFHDFLNL